MTKRENYFELNLCDENFGSWGSQGIEVACKTWLSGGRVMVDHRTWYSHMFRTQGGDFGFPYPQSGRQVQNAKHYARDLFFNNKQPKQKYPLSWLVEKFWPVTGWTEDDLRSLKENDGVVEVTVPNVLVDTVRSTPTTAVIPTIINNETNDTSLTKGIIYYT